MVVKFIRLLLKHHLPLRCHPLFTKTDVTVPLHSAFDIVLHLHSFEYYYSVTVFHSIANFNFDVCDRSWQRSSNLHSCTSWSFSLGLVGYRSSNRLSSRATGAATLGL